MEIDFKYRGGGFPWQNKILLYIFLPLSKMRFTRSQARAQAAKEAEAILLQNTEASLLQAVETHTLLTENSEIFTLLPTILKDVPLELVTPRRLSNSTIIVPLVPSFIRKRLSFLLQEFIIFLFLD